MNSGTRLFRIVTHPLSDEIAIALMLISSHLFFDLLTDLDENFEQPRKRQQQFHE